MSDPDIKPVAPKAKQHRIPRSALRTTASSQELKGMRSVPRLGRDTWERLAEAQRIALFRARRLFPRNPGDVR